MKYSFSLPGSGVVMTIYVDADEAPVVTLTEAMDEVFMPRTTMDTLVRLWGAVTQIYDLSGVFGPESIPELHEMFGITDARDSDQS